MWKRDEEKTNVWAFRAKIRNITLDSYLWTRPSPERILHSSKQRDSKVYQVHDLRVSEIYSQAVLAEKMDTELDTMWPAYNYLHARTHPIYCSFCYTLNHTILQYTVYTVIHSIQTNPFCDR